MHDPVNPDAVGNKGVKLIAAIDVWSDEQPVGTRVHARELARLVCRYAVFISPAEHGPIKCARILGTNTQWERSGPWLVKIGIYGIDASPAAWIRETNPSRQSAQDHAAAYNSWAVDRGFEGHMSARRIVHYLRAAGYRLVAKPGNRAIYAR